MSISWLTSVQQQQQHPHPPAGEAPSPSAGADAELSCPLLLWDILRSGDWAAWADFGSCVVKWAVSYLLRSDSLYDMLYATSFRFYQLAACASFGLCLMLASGMRMMLLLVVASCGLELWLRSEWPWAALAVRAGCSMALLSLALKFFGTIRDLLTNRRPGHPPLAPASSSHAAHHRGGMSEETAGRLCDELRKLVSEVRLMNTSLQPAHNGRHERLDRHERGYYTPRLRK